MRHTFHIPHGHGSHSKFSMLNVDIRYLLSLPYSRYLCFYDALLGFDIGYTSHIQLFPSKFCQYNILYTFQCYWLNYDLFVFFSARSFKLTFSSILKRYQQMTRHMSGAITIALLLRRIFLQSFTNSKKIVK
jgi:hypothetical protein